MLVQILEPDFCFEDARGRLVQLVHDGYQQYNIIFSKKNVERGNHYHKLNEEAFYVISGKFQLKAAYGDEEEQYIFKTGDMFLIPPYVIHSFCYCEDTWLASMYSSGVENQDGTKDIYSEQEGTA